MQFDFSRIEDIDSFISIPEGRYTCRVAELREGVSREGDPRWSLRLEVALGEYAGRTAGWDSVTWSERGIRRVKHVLEALGLDVSGVVEISPADLLGREVVATFQSEEREDPFTGRRVLRLRVPYAGYTACPERDAGGPGAPLHDGDAVDPFGAGAPVREPGPFEAVPRDEDAFESGSFESDSFESSPSARDDVRGDAPRAERRKGRPRAGRDAGRAGARRAGAEAPHAEPGQRSHEDRGE